MPKTNQNRWTLILNPHAGGGRGAKDKHQLEKLLKARGFQYELLVSEYPKHAILLAKHAVENGARQLIIAGGDGTLNEVVNGVLQQQKCSLNEIKIGMIPVGTGNDWIKTFGIPNNYRSAINKLEEGKTFFQDVGKLTLSENGETSYRYFSNMAGFGFDALVAQKANAMKEKGRTGFLVYLQSLLMAYLQYKIRKVNISVDREQIEDLIFSVSVGIGKYNGGGMMQAPGAVPNNGIFEVTLIKKIGVWGILTNLVGLYNGSYVKDSRVVCFKAEEVFISSQKPLAGEVDGESLGKSQFHIEILPRKLQVIVGEILVTDNA
ncbi:MAG: diacylglycerol kinase family protein [Bacteroidota bacterium]